MPELAVEYGTVSTGQNQISIHEHAMIIHMDMDAFYASVEERENPALADAPLIVGGNPEGRGVVATCNYRAREFGVRSAMPAAEAKRRCPQAVFIPPRLSLYREASRRIFDIAGRYTPLIEPLSLDEAFLDVSQSRLLFGDDESIARRIKREVLMEQGLTASMGIGPNKLVAKIASDLEKPDGFTVVLPESVQSLMDSLPIRRLWGVGKVGAEKLARMGITTVAGLRRHPVEALRPTLGDFAEELLRRANGIDDRPVNPHSETKSVSHENTFEADISDHAKLLVHLSDFADQVAAQLRKKGLKGRTVVIKLRFPDFRLISRARSLAATTDSTSIITQVARELLDAHHQPGTPIRLLGVGVSGFGDDASPEQGDLFSTSGGPDSKSHHDEVDSVTDEIRARFGRAGLRRARGLARE